MPFWGSKPGPKTLQIATWLQDGCPTPLGWLLGPSWSLLEAKKRSTTPPSLTLPRPSNLTSRQNVSGDAAHADQQVSVTLEFCAHHDHNPLAGTASLRQGVGQELRRPRFFINSCLPIRTMFKGSRVRLCKSCMRFRLSQNS